MHAIYNRKVVTWLSIMHMGLVLLVLPARAAQTDYAALERRLAAVESALTELEKIENRYRTIEDELTLHLAVVQREEAEIQRNYSKFKALIQTWAYIGKLDPEGTEAILNQTQKQTKELRSAFTAWSQQVQQARQAQEEICANKARIDSGSPRQIAKWNEDGSRLLKTHTTQLREKRKVLTGAWNSLNSVSSELAIQLGRLEGFMEKKEEYQTAYSRIKALANTSKLTCEELEKDLARTRELRNELEALRMASPVPVGGFREELKWTADSVTNISSTSEREKLKNRINRIDSALARLESTTLSRRLPEVPELDSRCETFVDASGQLGSAKMRANLQQIEPMVADARSALSGARAALKEASGTQAGFGGLGKARNCLAFLRRAQADAEETDVDEVFSLVDELQTRLEEAERQEHIFTTRDRENRARSKVMEQMVDDAWYIYQTWVQVGEELQEHLGPLEPDKAMQNLEQLLSALERQVEKLGEAARGLTEAIQDAEQQRQSTCERAAKAGSVPFPSSAELQTWHQESKSDISRVRQALEEASKKVQVQAGQVAMQAQEVTASRDKLSAVKDKLLIRLKVAADFHVQMVQEQKKLKKASDIWEQVTSEGKALERLRRANLEELKSIQDPAAGLVPRLLNKATIAELKAIEARAAALASRYPQSTVADEPDHPEKYSMVEGATWRKN